jgi:acetylornithine deacetylase/succinyl-diaminopimelate desuccinylase-like protein
MHEDLITAINALFPSVRAGLERLVAVPSISAPDFDPASVRASAELAASLLEEAGASGVALLEVDGAHPAVFGEVRGPAGAPTVLLYAHHDVQPPGDESLWSSPAFTPTERNGRLYGRGASDDKAGLMAHIAALTALRGSMPVNVKVIFEGEEEIGSLHMSDFLAKYGDRLAADTIVIGDSANWRAGQPAITTSLRGLVDCVVEVRTARHGVHSGMFGGPLSDALTILARLLATLHDGTGRPAVEGLLSRDADALDLTEAELREQTGVVDGLQFVGSGTLTSRIWTQPAIAVLAIDAPPVAQAINQLVPFARAKISVRLAPGDDPHGAMAALEAHLRARVPWGAEFRFIPGAEAESFELRSKGRSYEAFHEALATAWGRPAIDIGMGGAIPLVAALEQRFPQASVLLTGPGDPTSRWHAPDESQDLEELRRGCIAEAIALRLIGAS